MTSVQLERIQKKTASLKTRGNTGAMVDMKPELRIYVASILVHWPNHPFYFASHLGVFLYFQTHTASFYSLCSTEPCNLSDKPYKYWLFAISTSLIAWRRLVLFEITKTFWSGNEPPEIRKMSVSRKIIHNALVWCLCGSRCLVFQICLTRFVNPCKFYSQVFFSPQRYTHNPGHTFKSCTKDWHRSEAPSFVFHSHYFVLVWRCNCFPWISASGYINNHLLPDGSFT